MMIATQTIKWSPLSPKHKKYIKTALENQMSVAEGAIRSGKTIDNCIISAIYLETCPDKIHLASGSTIGNAKLNIGVCNGFGLENLFRGRCHWGKFKDNEALFIDTQTGEKIVVFTGGGKADSYKRILGNSYGLWIATEINEHYDSDDSRTSFIKVAFGRQVASEKPMILWDLNPSSPTHPIYTQYIDKYKETYVGGYQYEHFTINDNLSVSEERKREIMSRYDVNSIWYKRDILGQRCVAEGLIYPMFANDEERYLIEEDEIPPLSYIEIGADVGGNKSNHAYCASGYTADRNVQYVLKSKSYQATGTTVTEYRDNLVAFADEVKARYGFVDTIWIDNAEQAILNEVDATVNYNVRGSIKGEIIDRCRCTDILLSQDRIKFVREQTDSIQEAMRTAIWDSKKDDTPLDDGTYDRDSIDAFDYSFTPHISYLVRG